MKENICLHAINAYYEIYYPKINLKVLESILKDNAILSKRLQGIKDSNGFNGLDYISLCDYQKRHIHHLNHPYYTSYDSYIKESLSLMFPMDKLSIITPYILNIICKSKKSYRQMAYLGTLENTRYSDLYDEVQVKNSISLDLLCGITIPTKKLTTSLLTIDKNANRIIKHLNSLKSLLITYNHLVPIYDIDSMTELTNEEDIKQLIKIYTKKI